MNEGDGEPRVAFHTTNNKRPDNIPLSVTSTPSKHGHETQIQSPVGEGLIGLRYIDDTGSQEFLISDHKGITLKTATGLSQHDHVRGGEGGSPSENHPDPHPNNAIISQPQFLTPTQCYPPQLDILLDAGQVVVHVGNLRKNVIVNENALSRMEIIDETRRMLFHVEEDHSGLPSNTSFRFRIYNKDLIEVIQVYCPGSSTCVCCGISCHCMRRCRYQAIVYTPPGVIAGFIRRSRTCLVQEFEILNASEEPVLLIKGAPQDLEIYSVDLENELGRISVHGWHGIMHEVRRTAEDHGMTFPIDLDVRVKAILIGAIFAIRWLYCTRGGKTRQAQKQ